MPKIPPEVASAFPLPWRVEVNPFGESKDGGEDNVFVVSAEGSGVLIVTKHPVWGHMSKARMALAQYVVDLANGQ